MAAGTQRMAARDPAQCEPAALERAMKFDGIAGVVGTRRNEPAGPRIMRRDQKLVGSDEGQRELDARAPIMNRRLSAIEDVRPAGGFFRDG